jgi:hypothetical protein
LLAAHGDASAALQALATASVAALGKGTAAAPPAATAGGDSTVEADDAAAAIAVGDMDLDPSLGEALAPVAAMTFASRVPSEVVALLSALASSPDPCAAVEHVRRVLIATAGRWAPHDLARLLLTVAVRPGGQESENDHLGPAVSSVSALCGPLMIALAALLPPHEGAVPKDETDAAVVVSVNTTAASFSSVVRIARGQLGATAAELAADFGVAANAGRGSILASRLAATAASRLAVPDMVQITEGTHHRAALADIGAAIVAGDDARFAGAVAGAVCAGRFADAERLVAARERLVGTSTVAVAHGDNSTETDENHGNGTSNSSNCRTNDAISGGVRALVERAVPADNVEATALVKAHYSRLEEGIAGQENAL